MRSSWLAALVLVACATPLPSAEPLGEGPLAKAEAKERARAEAEGDAGSVVAQKPSGKPKPAEPKPDAAPPPTAVASATAPTDAGTPPAAKDAGAAPAPATDLAGEYVGSDVSRYKLGGMERDEKDDKARTRVAVPAPGEVAFTFLDSGTGKEICTLKATLAGKTATLTAGQKCWGTDDASMSGTLTKGSATFKDKSLVLDADFDLAVGGGGGFAMTGTLGYHFEGTRK